MLELIIAIMIMSCSSALLTGFLRYYAVKISLIDHPNLRSSHVLPTPRGGGMATVIIFLAGTVYLWKIGLISSEAFKAVTVCGGLVSIIGFVDDHRHLSAGFRFLIHVLAAAGVLFFLEKLPVLALYEDVDALRWVAYLLFLIALVWMVNLYNFMDGIDGIAGVETLTVTGGAAFIIWTNGGNAYHAVWLILLAAATSGFLFWNWPPAKIFMGDGCSGFLGLSLAALALITSADGAINIWSWLILLGVFLMDATVTLVRRIVRGDNFFAPHRSHAYQILARRYKSHKKVTLGLLTINLIWLMPWSLASAHYPEYAVGCFSAAFLPLIVLVFRTGAGILNE